VFNLPLIAKPIRTRYWRPGDDFLRIIVDSIASDCENGDTVVISEKAVSVAMGRVVDESSASPSLMAKVLARVWMRLVWGYVLGPLCRLRRKTLWRLRWYPIPEGEAHKEIVLRYAGLGQSLLHYSEGGIDVTNLPYALAALPLPNPEEVGAILLKAVKKACGKEATVMITDTDKTYSRNSTHITPRPRAITGIRPVGLLALIVGRLLRWTARATPLAVCGRSLTIEDALAVAEVADRARGFGAGRTVWDMASRFHVGLMDVTWEMLDRVEHYPIVIVREVE
jgi:F420-0:gamma-glutamyl ligase-like protein